MRRSRFHKKLREPKAPGVLLYISSLSARDALRANPRHVAKDLSFGLVHTVLSSRCGRGPGDRRRRLLHRRQRDNRRRFSRYRLLFWSRSGSLSLGDADLRYSRAMLRDYGNLSSPFVLFVLDAALRAGAPGGNWWMSSFGAGFSCHGALLEVA